METPLIIALDLQELNRKISLLAEAHVVAALAQSIEIIASAVVPWRYTIRSTQTASICKEDITLDDLMLELIGVIEQARLTQGKMLAKTRPIHIPAPQERPDDTASGEARPGRRRRQRAEKSTVTI